MTADRINQVFKLLGKMLAMLDIMQGQLDDYDVVSLNLNRQFDTGPKSPLDAYGEMLTGVVTVAGQVGQVLGFIQQIQDITATAINNYLVFLAPELGLAGNATFTTILQTLASQMSANGLTIRGGGRYSSYFVAQFNFTGFPLSNTPAIAEEWVTSDLV